MDREDKPLVASQASTLFWIALLAASAVLLVGGQSVEEFAVFALVALVFAGTGTAYRLSSFRRKSASLLSTGQSLQAFDYKAQSRRGVYLLLAILVFFFLPFLLAGLLDTYSWLGAVAGGIDGWLLSLLVVNFYLRRWEKAHRGRLYSSRVWRGTKVAQTGLRFDRSGDKA
jgi:hypothetical protein